MKYELFLRRERALADDELAAIRARVDEAPGLILDVFRHEGAACGVDLGVETGAPEGDRALCAAAFALAAAHALAVYDPQLASPVDARDQPCIAERFAVTAAYAEGASVVIPAATTTTRRGLAPRARAWVYLGAGIAALLLLGRALTCALP